MAVPSYNPFKKPIQEIIGDDLSVLKEVSEGWYVDYKERPINIRDLAKHISAFANQYGGWLFFGIKEDSSHKRVADSFPGIQKENISSLLTQIREAAVTHVNPEVYFEEKVVDGPVDEIGLESDCSVVVLSIPQGPNPPYIHSSGRIYRRTADQSSPKEETDRHVLDILWNRGQANREKLSQFILDIPSLLPPYEFSPHFYLNYIADSEFELGAPSIRFETFCDLMRGEGDIEGIKIPMDNFYSTADGFIARQMINQDISQPMIEFRWWHNGNARLTIPINTLNIEIADILSDRGYLQISRFVEIWEEKKFTHNRFCDLSLLATQIAAITNHYLHLLRESTNERHVYCGARIHNANGLVPYVDDNAYIKQVERTGIPYIQDGEIFLPKDSRIESLFKLNLDRYEGEDDPFVQNYERVAILLFNIFQALGVINDFEHLQTFSSIFFPRHITGFHTND